MRRFSSNKWNASMDIIRTEARIDCLRKYASPKRKYTKRNDAYWLHGGHQDLAVIQHQAGQIPPFLPCTRGFLTRQFRAARSQWMWLCDATCSIPMATCRHMLLPPGASGMSTAIPVLALIIVKCEYHYATNRLNVSCVLYFDYM